MLIALNSTFRLNQDFLCFLHHFRSVEYFYLKPRKFSAGRLTKLLLICISLSFFWLIQQQFWCETYSALQSSAASWGVSSNAAEPDAWLSNKKLITRVTFNNSHHWMHYFFLPHLWQISNVYKCPQSRCWKNMLSEAIKVEKTAVSQKEAASLHFFTSACCWGFSDFTLRCEDDIVSLDAKVPPGLTNQAAVDIRCPYLPSPDL